MQFSEMALFECSCEPIGALRSRADLSTNDPEQLIIQLVLSGQEYVKLGDQEAVLKRGDIFVWDTTQPMTIEMLEPLHKLSLVLPLQRLKDWVQGQWSSFPRCMRQEDSGTEILSSFVQGLSRIDYGASPMRQNALIEAAIAMIVAPVAEQSASGIGAHAQLDIVKLKIRKRLRDPDLDLSSIAQGNRISLRYLHQLFEKEGGTPWRFITQERMEGCYRDLVNPAFRHRTITDIAFSWGFSNVANFSRKVKSTYGISASEIRIAALNGRPS